MNKPDFPIPDKILVFTLDESDYAITLSSVIKIIHAIEIRHLPNAPEIISGIINVQGNIIPVVDFRWRLGLDKRETDPDDRVIIADTGKRKVAIYVNTVEGIKELNPDAVVNSDDAISFAGYLKGIAKLEGNIILIYDIEDFLSLDEEKMLEKALRSETK